MGVDAKKEAVYQNETLMEKYQRYIYYIVYMTLFQNT